MNALLQRQELRVVGAVVALALGVAAVLVVGTPSRLSDACECRAFAKKVSVCACAVVTHVGGRSVFRGAGFSVGGGSLHWASWLTNTRAVPMSASLGAALDALAGWRLNTRSTLAPVHSS